MTAADWQDIASAPKDGTPILGGYFNQPWCNQHCEGRIVRCWFQPEFGAFISSCRQILMAEGCSIDGQTTKLHSPTVEGVTHWLPLRPPPGEGTAIEEGE